MSDTYFSTEVCVERLYTEYTKHKRLIVAVDFDSTVYPWKTESSHEQVLTLVKKCSDLGFYIVIFSASDAGRYQFMGDFLNSKGIKVSSINKNPIDLPYGNNGKIYYNLLLDDRSGLGQSVEILNKTLDLIENK